MNTWSGIRRKAQKRTYWFVLKRKSKLSTFNTWCITALSKYSTFYFGNIWKHWVIRLIYLRAKFHIRVWNRGNRISAQSEMYFLLWLHSNIISNVIRILRHVLLLLMILVSYFFLLCIYSCIPFYLSFSFFSLSTPSFPWLLYLSTSQLFQLCSFILSCFYHILLIWIFFFFYYWLLLILFVVVSSWPVWVMVV